MSGEAPSGAFNPTFVGLVAINGGGRPLSLKRLPSFEHARYFYLFSCGGAVPWISMTWSSLNAGRHRVSVSRQMFAAKYP